MAGATAGLETNDLSEFTGETDAGGLLSVSTAQANTGTHSMMIDWDGVSRDAYCYWTISEADVYLRAYLYVDTFVLPAWEMHQLLKIDDDVAGVNMFRIRLYRDNAAAGNAGHWSVDGHGLASTQTADADIYGNWHRIEAHWLAGTGANGGLVVRINGLQIYSDIDNDLTGHVVTGVNIGSPQATWLPGAASLMYFDDMGWSDVDWLGEAAEGGAGVPKFLPEALAFKSIEGLH